MADADNAYCRTLNGVAGHVIAAFDPIIAGKVKTDTNFQGGI
jgi:hypothetical protein